MERTRSRVCLWGIVAWAATVAGVGGVSAATSTVTVDAQSNLYASGRSSAFSGVLPPAVALSPGPGKLITFPTITGLTHPFSGSPNLGPEGQPGTTDISSFQGIAGILHYNRRMFLAGVFLDDSVPADPAPPILNFTYDYNYTTLAPQLRQVFFIGDGLTGLGTGTLQQVEAPATATRLFLGFAKAYSFRGAPGWYEENRGSLTVTLEISAGGPAPGCTYAISPTSSNVGAGGGSGQVSVTTTSGCQWTAATNAAWITISAGASGTGNGTVSYSVPANTGASRNGTLTIAEQTFTVTQAGTTPPSGSGPTISEGGVVNGADYTTGFSPGMLLSVFGTNLAPGTELASGLPLPTSLSGVSVEIVDGSQAFQAPLFFVSVGQINCQIPYSVGVGAVQVRVRTAEGVSGEESIIISERTPRLLTKTADGQGEALVLHADYSLVSEESPATAGEIVALYLAGLGAVTPGIQAGQPAGDGGPGRPLNLVPKQDVEVRVGELVAVVHWAGLAPGWAGLYQINFEVPGAAPMGMVPVEVSMLEERSQRRVNLACGRGWQALATASIGPSGGSVGATGIDVTFASGALSETNTITVQRATSGVGDDPDRVSDVFSVLGLPEETHGPITIECPPTGTIPPGDVLLAVQEGESGPIMFVDGRVESGKLVATIPERTPQVSLLPSADGARPAMRTGKGLQEWRDLLIYYVAGYRSTLSSAGNFRIRYPFQVVPDVVASTLEIARSKLLEMGFDRLQGQPKPIQVYLSTANTDEFFGSTCGLLNQMAVRPAVLDESASVIKAKVAHLLFHFVQDLYRPKYVYFADMRDWLWMDEATATWFERHWAPGVIPPDSKYIPAEALQHIDFPVQHGLEYPIGLLGSKTAARQHGYGASMFIEYLATTGFNSTAFIHALYYMRLETSSAVRLRYSPVEALELLVNIPVEAMSFVWRDFIHHWLRGRIYPAAEGFLPLPRGPNPYLGRQPVVSLLGSMRESVTVRWPAPDLSVRTNEIWVGSALPQSPDKALAITVTGVSASKGIVYIDRFYRSGKEVIGEGGFMSLNSTLRIEDLSLYFQGTDCLMLTVVNARAVKPYNQVSPFEIKAELVHK